jgi:hypothetical protein
MLRPAGVRVVLCVKEFTNARPLSQLSVLGSSVSAGRLDHRRVGPPRPWARDAPYARPVSDVPRLPAPLGVAVAVVTVQGVGLLGLAVLGLLDLVTSRVEVGLSLAVFFGAYGAGLLACAWALTRRQVWARGPVLLTQLIELGVAWNSRENLLLALPLGLVGLVGLVAMVQRSSVEALLGAPEDDLS